LIQQGRVSGDLNSKLQIRAAVGNAKDTSIKVQGVDLVRGTEKSLRNAVALRIAADAETRGMAAGS
jgi:hypothetical protein